MKTLTYKLAPEQYGQKLSVLKKALGEDLIEVTPNSGVVKHKGVEAHYAFNPVDEIIVINIDHKPWIVPESEIEDKLSEWFKM